MIVLRTTRGIAQPPNCALEGIETALEHVAADAADQLASRSGAQSNSAVHSMKVRSPSVTGVSRSVAT